MRPLVSALSFILLLSVSARPGAAQHLPACNPQLITRHGNQITIGFHQLSDAFNRKLRAAHSSFRGLRLAVTSAHTLKVSGKKNGNTISVSGPLQAVGNGSLKLHANHIVRNGDHDKGLMDLFGKTLADYAHFSKTQSLSADNDNLYIHPDPLLDVSGPVTSVSLNQSSVTLTFASQPCR